MQTISGEANTFQRRIADNSIGISCSVPYKSMTLFNGARRKMQGEAKVEHVVVEDSSGHRWIEGYMDWFVKRVSHQRVGQCPGQRPDQRPGSVILFSQAPSELLFADLLFSLSRGPRFKTVELKTIVTASILNPIRRRANVSGG